MFLKSEKLQNDFFIETLEHSLGRVRQPGRLLRHPRPQNEPLLPGTNIIKLFFS